MVARNHEVFQNFDGSDTEKLVLDLLMKCVQMWKDGIAIKIGHRFLKTANCGMHFISDDGKLSDFKVIPSHS